MTEHAEQLIMVLQTTITNRVARFFVYIHFFLFFFVVLIPTPQTMPVAQRIAAMNLFCDFVHHRLFVDQLHMRLTFAIRNSARRCVAYIGVLQVAALSFLRVLYATIGSPLEPYLNHV